MRKQINATKKYVSDHKTVITIVLTATAMQMIHKTAMKQHNEFLKANGLYDQFYTPEAV